MPLPSGKKISDTGEDPQKMGPQRGPGADLSGPPNTGNMLLSGGGKSGGHAGKGKGGT